MVIWRYGDMEIASISQQLAHVNVLRCAHGRIMMIQQIRGPRASTDECQAIREWLSASGPGERCVPALQLPDDLS